MKLSLGDEKLVSIQYDEYLQLLSLLSIRIPEEIKVEDIDAQLDIGHLANGCLLRFLRDDANRYNKVIRMIRKEIFQLREATNGNYSLTPRLEKICSNLRNLIVPTHWYPYLPTHLPFNQWLEDLSRKVATLTSYIKTSQESDLNDCDLRIFYQPAGFLDSLLQDYNGLVKAGVLEIDFEVKIFNDSEKKCDHGIHLLGLQLHNAAWDFTKCCITQVKEAQATCPLPIIWLRPIKLSNKVKKSSYPTYSCPVLHSYYQDVDKNCMIRLSLATEIEVGILYLKRVAISVMDR
ncbi:uncharacterized protein TRIADDRAFT_54031 [Trichoplax adhaerens]|uniref:Dynein heavy chain C-terminal domain-containing protein n=1 Tax=Trichoplax adhaerens TaxID=10228 RepID=B3RQX2_TRIAD|nr:hypothetical protein TRIADDRAFT_54031 [Trichoplax adhaerens]EDV26241.1 hypothetical protein TRIADDRAFT_54031 [Trichoplax adhaerens]|eukprot:XP_002110237.1 hypothetical protein TRIADDRAFT_54031 [Trichoplax adhaerens]